LHVDLSARANRVLVGQADLQAVADLRTRLGERGIIRAFRVTAVGVRRELATWLFLIQAKHEKSRPETAIFTYCPGVYLEARLAMR
jgi:hypothetical protein